MAKKQKPLLMQLITFILIVVILISLFVIVKSENYNRVKTTPAKILKNNYCRLLRPPGWTGLPKGNSFLFRNPHGVILVTTDQCSQYYYSSIDNNKKRFLTLLHEVLKDKKIKLDKIKNVTINNDRFGTKFPTLKFRITTEKKTGKGTLFFTNDLRVFYISIWEKGNKRNEYISNVFTDFIKLNKGYKNPLYERPTINTQKNIDSSKLIQEAKKNIKQALSIWKNSKNSSNEVLQAMKSFERAMKLIAESGMGDMVDKKDMTIIETYMACREARKANINKFKSEIFQSRHLGNYKMAKELAKELLTMASLDSEAEVREWAKKQIKEIK